MNEYTQELVKKEDEKEALEYFLEAYEQITGETLSLLKDSERPDFICERTDGTVVGIELSKVRRSHPNDIMAVEIVFKRNYMLPEAAFKVIQMSLLVKETKRRESSWQLPESTILILELVDIPLIDLKPWLRRESFPDLADTGFLEIWLADYTGLEAYDNVELFCLRPEQWHGYHRRLSQKPYG